MRRRSPSADRLLELAIQTVDDKGEAAVRVQELCDEAGVAITVLYRFFGNREGLIEAVHAERYVRTLLDDTAQFAAAVDDCRSGDDVRQLLERTMRRFFSIREAPSRMMRANAVGSAHSRPELATALAEAQERFNTALGEALATLQRNGWIRQDLHPHTLAAWLAGQVLSRVLIELGPTRAKATEWNRMTRTAILAVVMGDAPIEGGSRRR